MARLQERDAHRGEFENGSDRAPSQNARPPSTVERHLDNESRKTLPVDAGFGVASSSCSCPVARHAGVGERKAT
jgi:hypothetical protein